VTLIASFVCVTQHIWLRIGTQSLCVDGKVPDKYDWKRTFYSGRLCIKMILTERYKLQSLDSKSICNWKTTN